MERHTALTDDAPRERRDDDVGRAVEARRGLGNGRRARPGRVPGRARARRPDRRRHARQVPRRGTGCNRVPRAPLPDARRRSREGPPALRAAARGGRRDHRRRHRLCPRRRSLLPDRHDIRCRAARVVDARLGRGLGPRRATSSTRRRRSARSTWPGRRRAGAAREAVRRPARPRELPVHPAPRDHRGGRAVPRDAPRLRRRTGATSCISRPRAPRSSGTRCSPPATEWDIRPFGLIAQRLLRLEKGHIIVSQDTDFETTPWKIGMELGGEARQGRVRRQGRPAARPGAGRPRAARAVDGAEGRRAARRRARP